MLAELKVHCHNFKSNDPDEISAYLGNIYTETQFALRDTLRGSVVVVGHEWNGVGIYDIECDMPFDFRSDFARTDYMVFSCHRGDATFSSEALVSQCSIGDVIPISSSESFICRTGCEGLGYLSVTVDSAKLNDFLARLVGRTLQEPIQFDFTRISSDISAQWNMAARCLHQMMQMSPVPYEAAHALFEHMLKSIVTGHSSNHSAQIGSDHNAQECLARSAIALIQADPVRWRTLTAIAHMLGSRSCVLASGIRRLTGKGSTELVYEARLSCVNRALASGVGCSFVGTLQAYGFAVSSRFVREYRRRFGEPPSETYRRNPCAIDVVCAFPRPSDLLCERGINEFIESSLAKPIRLADLARHFGMSEHATIDAFKERFSLTPMQYVIERRLERAQWLLRNTSYGILSVAIECGFGSQSYLTTVMKKYIGVTPYQYRVSGGNGS